MRILNKCIFLCLFSVSFFANIAIFTPPKDWKLSLPKEKKNHLKIAYAKKGFKFIRPSINLSIEKISTSKENYLLAVKNLYKNDSLKDLGEIQTKQGLANLFEIKTSQDIQMLQMVLLKNNHAYILTSAFAKDDFSSVQKEIIQSFQSFNLLNDLFASIDNPLLKQKIQTQYNLLITSLKNKNLKQKKSSLKSFEKFLNKNMPDINPYLKYLLMEKAFQDSK